MVQLPRFSIDSVALEDHFSLAMQKVNKELKKLEKDPLDFATLTVNTSERVEMQLRDGTNIVDATLLGPEESPYDGGAFHLEITIPSNYPLVAPTVEC